MLFKSTYITGTESEYDDFKDIANNIIRNLSSTFEKIEKHILSSEFEIIDPEDLELNGQRITVIPELICEEVLMYYV